MKNLEKYKNAFDNSFEFPLDGVENLKYLSIPELDINVGEPFTSSNIRSIRPSYGLHPKCLKRLLGKLSPTSLKAGEPSLPESLLENLSII